MCHPVQCKTCKKITWAGCGSHVAQVRSHVPADNWCDGHPKDDSDPGGSWLQRIRRPNR